ncbi:MAG: glycosyltransferase family 4 protein [Actinobacteria bacterium]|nr:MAG: glycosyltransferase family 4 protein [Actinomycetota bacterium]
MYSCDPRAPTARSTRARRQRGRVLSVSKHVLLVSWEYPPVIEGGLARHVRKLAEALVRQGAAVDVLTRAIGGSAAPAGGARKGLLAVEDVGGVRVHRVPEPGWPRDLDRFVAWVEQMNEDMLDAGKALAEEEDFDLIHGHDWLVARAAAALADRLGVPYVTTVHATEHGRHQGWVQDHPQSHIHAVERWMANRADAVIVCSYYMRGHVADIFDIAERRITVIPNGIDPSEMRAVGDLQALRLEFARPDEKLVLFVGRLVYEKGFQLALDALPGVIEQVAGVRFLVAGSGTHEAELKAQACRLGLSGHGSFLGWIGDDVLHSLYRIADLCVVPSIYEPFGLVALEAMAAGCPCIVADTGGLREVVPRGERVGLRFNGGDAAHLGVMIERLLVDSRLRERLVAEASEHVLRFDWDDIAARTRGTYGELAGREGAGRRAGELATRHGAGSGG